MRRVPTAGVALVAALALVLVVALVLGGLWWWGARDRTPLQEAVGFAPHDAERLSWTDWAAVRRELDSPVSADSTPAQLGKFLDQGYEADLTSASALVESAPVLQSRFGISPANAQWELFSQSAQGAVVIVRLPDSLDVGGLGDTLEGLGYERPSGDSQVWRGGTALLPDIGAALTPELQYAALDEDDHLLLTSDNADYLAGALDDATSGGGVTDEMTAVVDASGSPLSASVYDGDYTCSALAMGHASRSDQRQGEDLLAEAGEVDPVTAFAMSVQPDRDVRVVMGFADDDQARRNADTRAALAAGPAPGQGGDFADRFSVRSVTADGKLVTMALHPTEGAYVLSDLSTGPVLFATC